MSHEVLSTAFSSPSKAKSTGNSCNKKILLFFNRTNPKLMNYLSCPVLKASIFFLRKGLRPNEVTDTHTVIFFFVCLHHKPAELQLGFVC